MEKNNFVYCILNNNKLDTIFDNINYAMNYIAINKNCIIKPKLLNSNRRYYDEKTINLLKKVKFLLKDQGMTINGVKKILNKEDSLKLDEIADKSIRAENLKKKLLNISNKLKELKNGKKNTR